MTFVDAALDVGGSALAEFEGLGEEAANAIREHGHVRIPVASAAIVALDYNLAQMLTVEFNDGSVYEMENFPAVELYRWLNADSIGTYFNRYVRGRYTGRHFLTRRGL